MVQYVNNSQNTVVCPHCVSLLCCHCCVTHTHKFMAKKKQTTWFV